jgi:GNAT superfamily N-acetyltransferase
VTDLLQRTIYETISVGPEDTDCDFRCGHHSLDDFLNRHAISNDQQGVGKTFVLHSDPGEGNQPKVLGFYTLSMANVKTKTVESAISGSLPRYDMPVALIGRLAVHKYAQGRGVGPRLLRDALLRVCDIADQIGCIGIIVDAKDENAAHFYSRFGFIPIYKGSWPNRMFMPLSVARDSLRR